MTDIALLPTNPISQSYIVEGRTTLGRAFVRQYSPKGIITGERAVLWLAHKAKSHRLVLAKDWSCARKALAS